MAQPAVGRYGRLYQVRQKGSQPELYSGLDEDARAGYDEVRPLFVDRDYDGDDPAYWKIGTRIYSGDCGRAWLEAKYEDEEVLPLRFREDVEQNTLEAFIGGEVSG